MNEPVMEALSAPDQSRLHPFTSAYRNFSEAKDGRASRADRPDDNQARLWVEQPPMVDSAQLLRGALIDALAERDFSAWSSGFFVPSENAGVEELRDWKVDCGDIRAPTPALPARYLNLSSSTR